MPIEQNRKKKKNPHIQSTNSQRSQEHPMGGNAQPVYKAVQKLNTCRKMELDLPHTTHKMNSKWISLKHKTWYCKSSRAKHKKEAP